MIRFVLRFVGLLSLALGFIFLVYDGTKSIADQTVYISTVESTWSNIHQNSLTSLQPEVERRVGTWVWHGLVQPYFLDQPVSLVLAIIGAILKAGLGAGGRSPSSNCLACVAISGH